MRNTHHNTGGPSIGPSWVRISRALAHFRSDISFALVDAFFVSVAYLAALVIRFTEMGGVPAHWWSNFAVALPVIVALHLGSNLAMGTYGHVWAYASIAEARRVILASLVTLAILVGGTVLFFESHPMPLSVLVLGSLFSLSAMGAVRFRSRLFSFRRAMVSGERQPTLIVGVGRRAAELARSIDEGDHAFEVVGIISQTPYNGIRRLAGHPVLGQVESVPDLVRRLGISQVILAYPETGLVRRMVDLCVATDVRLRILPDLSDILSDRPAIRDVRDLEIADLLGRPAVSTDLAEVGAALQGKRVLVTGAGGSIGSELVTQVLRFPPAAAIVLDNDESHLHEAMLRWQPGGTEVIPVLCDIRDRLQLERVVRTLRPDVVFHAAAHKHVPILEQWPEEAVKTNVFGTVNLLRAAQEADVERFVLISTDKAVHPSSVMGASKRLAEMLVQSAARDGAGRCVYTAVRFGNVLGSRGSVIPTFLRQIQKGGPITVTDDRMLRYFMTAEEASELVLQAGALARGGEILVLEMGEPMRVIDLANRLIRLAGLIPGRDIEIRYSGVRPGEKLQETLSHGVLVESAHPKIRVARADVPPEPELSSALEKLSELVDGDRADDLRAFLLELTGGVTSTIVIDLTSMVDVAR